MTREWKLGDVAMGTWRTGGHVFVVRYDTGHESGWWTSRGTDRYHDDAAFSDIRPLVVIDTKGNPEGLEYLVPQHFRNYAATLRKHHGPVSAQMLEWLADQLEAFVPKPPRPEEPTGLGAVVEDGAAIWVRTEVGGAGWCPSGKDTTERYRCWADFSPAVRVLSEGVQP